MVSALITAGITHSLGDDSPELWMKDSKIACGKVGQATAAVDVGSSIGRNADQIVINRAGKVENDA